MTTKAEAVVAKVSKDPTATLTAEDAEALLAQKNRTLMMEKLLGMYFFKQGKFEEALVHAQKAFETEKTNENAKNIALLMRKAGRTPDAIKFALAHEELYEPIIFNDVMCMMYGDIREVEPAVRHGTKSLELKDAGSGTAPKIVPMIHNVEGYTPGKKVIAFSLWGRDQRYLTGALNNAIVGRYLYPGWTLRFYVDKSVPPEFNRQLKQNGAQVLVAPDAMPAATYGLFWRFMVEDDENVDVYIVRDADSVMNIRERVAVQAWLESGKAFHVMRDLPTHSELILAGMWGAHRGNIGNMRARVTQHLDAEQKRMNNVTTDQVFLRNVIWPIVKQDALVHDAHFNFGDPVRFDPSYPLPGTMHIGQNDWANYRRTG